MKRSFSINQKRIKTGVCVLLSIAIILGLFLPGADLEREYPENPLGDGSIDGIHVLNIGDDVNSQEQIIAPGEEGTEPSEPEETEPPQSEPPETDPPETDPPETEPPETIPPETLPPETIPPETLPPETEPDPDNGDEDEGNDDGNQGEEGGESLPLDLAAVMTWYKYGTDPNSLVCGASSTVAKTINTAQLVDNTLKYSFSLAGEDSRFVEIRSVSVAEGDEAYRETDPNGSLAIELPGGVGRRNYTFLIVADLEKPDGTGEIIREELTFTFLLKCEHSLDLELELTWYPKDAASRTISCGPDKTEGFSVRNYDLTERVFSYTTSLAGALAENARIVSCTYTTASGQKSGELPIEAGTLILDPAPGMDQEAYFITFTVRTPNRDVLYHFKVNYQETLDVQLAFHWMESGVTRRTTNCKPNDSATLRVKNNQLSAGAIPFALELLGKDGEDGRILSVSYTTSSGLGGNLEAAGSLAMSMPEGVSSNTYRLTVNAMVKGQRVVFHLVIHYSADVSLKMEYTVMENGIPVTRQIVCENTRAKTAESVYDDQLIDGSLQYTMTLVGGEGEQVSITSITCYQSGSGRVVPLTAQGQIVLLLKGGKSGENAFEIDAQDATGRNYHFSINIPYKHRGENNIQIQTNLSDGQIVINDTKTNLTVKAWSEDENGNVVSYIPANGVDTKLIVKLDGKTLHYVSSSGAASEYDLFPENPEIGDTNTHTLYIYAEDALGNFGEKTLNLEGQRRESGQKTGTATIYVDMTVLGLGVVANLSYDVLADEPVSYVIAKAIMGMDTGEPYGAAAETLGWNGRYAGTPDVGFYLQSLTTGHTANALEDSRWPGTTEAEVLQAIDDRFGAGTGLATLWRCLYRNGLNKSSGSGNSFGEFDYTSGSGWMYSIGGVTYYPGQSMSSVYLQDGDVLILRFTLAYGWDVGGGTAGYGSTVGYCVSAVNGTIRVSHRMEEVQNPDGSFSNVCRCCGIRQDCLHKNTEYIDLEDGMHIQYCNDCKKEIGDPEEHIWTYDPESKEDNHTCTTCGAAQTHVWKEIEGSNTATCTQSGTRSVACRVCNMIREEATGPRGHTLDNQWQYTVNDHYEKCSTCGQEANRGAHQYQYISGNGWEDFECMICHALHSDDGDNCPGTLTVVEKTCQKVVSHCDSCGYKLVREGSFPENHVYEGGECIHCGEPDPNPGATEPPVTPPPEAGQTEPTGSTLRKKRHTKNRNTEELT